MIQVAKPVAGRPYVLIQADGAKAFSDMAAGDIIQLYKTHGALVLRGFVHGLDSFRAFAEQFCVSAVFNESGGRDMLDPAHNIQSVNRGVAAFPLHPELSREPWKPDVCFFYCIKPPKIGGKTTVCDGVEIVRALPPDVRKGLEGRRLLYVQGAQPDLLHYWLGTAEPSDDALSNPPVHCPYTFQRIDAATVARSFSRPALHKPMFAEDLAFGNFLLFARYMRGRTDFPTFENGEQVPPQWVETVKQVSDGLTSAIDWQQGDLLMLDNSRFMHGRTAIIDPGERLIASYFGYLNFAEPVPEEPPHAPWRQAMFRPPVG